MGVKEDLEKRALKSAAGAAAGKLKRIAEGDGVLPAEERKSVLVGGLLGLFLPGLGLFYAAPFVAAAVLTLVAMAVMAPLLLLSSIPLIGLLFGWLKIIVIGVLALCSSLLGVLYVANYNKKGRRTPLNENAPEAKLPI
jgi:hypothetical protein